MPFEIDERVGAPRGDVIKALDEARGLRALADKFRGRRERSKAVAVVCCCIPISRPAHEQRIKAIFKEKLPGVPVFDLL